MRTNQKRVLRRLPALAVALLAGGLAACDAEDDGPFGPGPIGGEELEPLDVVAAYEWVFEGFIGTRAVGQPAVVVTWRLPEEWDGEPFRIYGKLSSSGGYTLIATSTSCDEQDEACRYVDLNVTPGQRYDYFVATELGRGSGDEEPSVGVSVDVPAASTPETPAAPSVTALDGALFLQWPATGAAAYLILVDAGDDPPFLVGRTDRDSYLDTRLENGVEVEYRIVGIDETSGEYSAASPIGRGTPRPDYHSEIVYAFGDDAAQSGFRFRTSEADVPIVAGGSGEAQWRLEVVDGVPVIRPLGSTTMTRGVFTTALTCGPGSESDCESIDEAPAASAFSAAAAPVEPGDSYVFRVTGDDGRTHYGKIRVQGATRDSDGRTLVVFDWAYQVRADSPSLSRG